MGESAVLLRSFSHPSDASREAKEGDPIRALTESISFGRFVSDSLAWEKWSTFSHNRYLEEVEKFSKPGSVAEKKAYFEAHYRRKAAVKAAAIHEANSAAKDGPELKNTSDICNDSQMDESVKADSHVAIHDEKDQHISNADTTSSMDTALATINSRVVIDERTEKDLPDIEVAESGDANACNSTNVGNKVDDADLERGLPVIECAINVENPTQSENFKQLKNADIRDKIVATPVQSNLKNEAVDEENLASSGKKKRSNWSSKSSTKTVASRLASHPSKQTHSLPPKSVNSVVINSKKSVGDLNEKKRVVPKTVHMSINFASDASETSKCSSKFSKDSSTPIRNSIRASFNGVSKHLSKILQSEDKRYLYRRNIHDRSKTLVNKSDSGGRAEDEKFYSLSMDSSQSSRANESKARPPSISSPFSFRSEERAAKRKEFFQKLQEKNNVKEAEKAQLETRLKKTGHDVKKLRQSTCFSTKKNEHLNCGSNFQSDNANKGKSENGNEMLRQSTGFKVKPNEDLNCGLTSPRNRMKKIHLTQPTPTAAHDGSFRPPRRPSISTESSKHAREKIYGSTTRSITSLPKLVRKPTTNMVQDATRPPWRSSMSTTGLKRVMEKNNRTTTVSVTSLPKKNAHENASPNIQC